MERPPECRVKAMWSVISDSFQGSQIMPTMVEARNGPYSRNRLFEWTMTVAMLITAWTIFAYPNSVTFGRFHFLADISFTPATGCLFFAIAGLLRAGALWANGSIPVYGPWCRVAGAFAGTFIWAQMAYALYLSGLETGSPSLGVGMYAALTGGELATCVRAAFDARPQRV